MHSLLSPGIRLLGRFGFARKFQILFFLFMLRVRRNRPEKQNQGSGTCSSKELHSARLHSDRLSNMHARDQSGRAASRATGIPPSYFLFS